MQDGEQDSGGRDRGPDGVAERLLLDLLRDREVECPRCGYNLANLTRPVCPECRESLVLRVGVQHFRLHYLLATLAPMCFSGIALGIFVTMSIVYGFPGPMPVEAILTLAFLAASGLCGVIVGLRSRAFLRQANSSQLAWAVITWVVHLVVFAVVMWNA
jgi:hypothetical protein